MSTIVEAELEDAGKNNAIRSLEIVQHRNKKYGIVVQLTWKEGVFTLVTQRKHVREWASLDRLIPHIENNYGKIDSISLSLYQPKKRKKAS